jgi:hypothetical protein
MTESPFDTDPLPVVDLKILDLQSKGHLGPGVCCDLSLTDGQIVTFVLRIPPAVGIKSTVSKPSLELAEKLGVPLDRVLSFLQFGNSWIPIIVFRLGGGCIQAQVFGRPALDRQTSK